MEEKGTFWIIGGDARLGKLAALLASEGNRVLTSGLEGCPLPPEVERRTDLSGLSEAEHVILPVPVLGEGDRVYTPLGGEHILLEEALRCLTPGQFLCGGMVSPLAARLAAAHGLTIRDYFAREELAVANAAVTAEGAVQIALEELEVALHGAPVLILGFGRVGRLTAHRMAALGAKVTVAARKSADLAWAAALGYESVRLEGEACCAGPFALAVNTVPAPVLTAPRLAGLPRDCLVLDLASRPGGVDRDGAAALGLRCVWALSLPGRVAPQTAARILRDTLRNMLRE